MNQPKGCQCREAASGGCPKAGDSLDLHDFWCTVQPITTCSLTPLITKPCTAGQLCPSLNNNPVATPSRLPLQPCLHA